MENQEGLSALWKRVLFPRGGPHAPRIATLGGIPQIIPDVPITSVLLAIYIVLAITHFKIMRANQTRGRLFAFSGAMLGFCKIRIVAMALRIAWTCHNTNANLALAAQIFTFAGTIIPLFINWFFAQRVVRAQHPHFGWSTLYRIIHRAGLVCLILSLFMLIVAFLQQSFALDPNIMRIDHALEMTGITYMAVFSFSPLIIVAFSLAFPRNRVDKFGAGRLRNNIAVLVIGTTIIATGTMFRCVVNWLPPVPLRNAQGELVQGPWYFKAWCFYVFTFVTEVLFVTFYAITRFDLRFHIPNGSKAPGDYNGSHDNEQHINVIGNEKNLIRRRSTLRMHALEDHNQSTETLQEFSASIFEDCHTLADSLRYPSSVLEVDAKSGHWKIKRASGATSIRTRASMTSVPSLWSTDRDTAVYECTPALPTEWPLRESQVPLGSKPVMVHHNRSARLARDSQHSLGKQDMPTSKDPRADAMSRLEANSANRRSRAESSHDMDEPPNYDSVIPTIQRSSRNLLKKKRPNSEFSTKCRDSIAPSVAPDTSQAIPPPPLMRHSLHDTGYGRSSSQETTRASNPQPQEIQMPLRTWQPASSSNDAAAGDFYNMPQSSFAEMLQEAFTPAALQPIKRVKSPVEESGRTSFDTAAESFRGFSFEASRQPAAGGVLPYASGSRTSTINDKR